MDEVKEINSKILVVDDEPDIREIFGSVFSEEGYQLSFADNGKDALKMAAGEAPDLILLDAMMPQMDGFEVCRRLRLDPTTAEIPVIMVTALNDPDSRIRGLDAGADDFISKPFDIDEMQARVKTIIKLDRYRKLVSERTKYEQLINLFPDGIIVIDHRRIIRMANPAAIAMLGEVNYKELIGKEFSLFIAEGQYEHCSSFLDTVSAGSSSKEIRTTLVDSSGGQIPVELTASRLTNAENSEMILVVHDITSRIEAQESLRKSEERFKQVAESAGEWIWEVDADGLYTYASPVAEKILGYKPEEIVGKKYFYDFFHPEDKESFKAAALAAFTAKQTLQGFVNRNVHKNGQTIWLATNGSPLVDDRGNLLGYRGSDMDITERKQAEDNIQEMNELLFERTVGLRQSEEKFRSLVENINDVLFNIDTKGKITYISPVAQAITGYSTDEYMEKNLTEFIHPEDIPQVISSFERSLKGDKAEIEFRTTTKDGSYRYVRSSTNPIIEAGSVVGLTGLITDITERKQAEEALRESEERFQLALTGADLGLWEWDIITGRVDRDSRWAQMLGYSLDEIDQEQHSLEKLLHPDDKERVMEVFAAHLRGETPFIDVEYRLRTKTGDYRWLLNRGKILEHDRDGNPTMAAGTTLDITEKKQTEEALLWEMEFNKTMAQLSRALIESASIEEISELILDHAKSMTKSRFGFVGYIDPKTGWLVSPTMTRDILKTCQIEDKDIVFKEFGGLWGWVLNEKESVMTERPLFRSAVFGRSRGAHCH